MSRKILLITTDQMRHDALGCNGGIVARTPVLDSLARNGINYKRAHNQHVVCMPARATIITGQYVATHGVWMNGVALPEETPTIAHWLSQHGYRTGLFGKAHFEPWLGAPETFYENRMARLGETGPHRGFERMELANHFYMRHSHYDVWLEQHHPEAIAGFYPMLTPQGMQNTRARCNRRDSGLGQPRAARGVSHGLGRAADDRVARQSAGAMQTGSSGSAFPTRIIRGIRRRRNVRASTGATCRCPTCIRGIRRRPRVGSPANRVTGRVITTARCGRISNRRGVFVRAT